MPSFPTSVFSAPTRSNGQTIDASHVDNLQDEVTAIEGGLRNGTAPLNSSNSTFTNLSVTGNCSVVGTLTVNGSVVTGGSAGSTFTSLQVTAGSTLVTLNVTGGSTLTTVQAGASTLTSLSVTGNSTVAALQGGASTLASLSVSGNSTFANSPTLPRWPCCRVKSSAAHQIANGTTGALNFDVQLFNTGNLHSTASNSSRITLTSSGIWEIGFQAEWRTASSVGTRQIWIAVNDVTYLAGADAAPSSAICDQCIIGIHYASVTTDYVTAAVTQTSGTTNSLNVDSTVSTPTYFWARRVSQ